MNQTEFAGPWLRTQVSKISQTRSKIPAESDKETIKIGQGELDEDSSADAVPLHILEASQSTGDAVLELLEHRDPVLQLPTEGRGTFAFAVFRWLSEKIVVGVEPFYLHRLDTTTQEPLASEPPADPEGKRDASNGLRCNQSRVPGTYDCFHRSCNTDPSADASCMACNIL